jgi:hypothetical protein
MERKGKKKNDQWDAELEHDTIGDSAEETPSEIRWKDNLLSLLSFLFLHLLFNSPEPLGSLLFGPSALRPLG